MLMKQKMGCNFESPLDDDNPLINENREQEQKYFFEVDLYKHDTEDAKSDKNEFTLQRDYNGQDIVVYFDTIMLAPRHYRDAELCFCL